MDSDRLVFVLNRKTVLQFHRGRDGERRVRGGRGGKMGGVSEGKGWWRGMHKRCAVQTSRAFEIFLRIRKSVMVQEIKGHPKSVLQTRAPRKAGFFFA